MKGCQRDTASSPHITGFLPLDEWSPYLNQHPDKAFAAFMERGLSHGFCIGFDHTSTLRPAPPNFHSVQANPATVERYMAGEIAAGRLVATAETHVRRNPIGIIPKPHQLGKFRLIIDLSAPQGFSVNDGISPPLCSMQYVTVDQVAKQVAQCGRGALMAKTDIRSAYRQVPVHEDDQHLLGLEWNGTTYIDKALPFGLRSAPKLFSAVADCLAWAMLTEGVVNCVHYLDDFFFWGPPASSDCASMLASATQLCSNLGLPVAPEKTVGLSTVIAFLVGPASGSLNKVPVFLSSPFRV